MHMHPYPMYIHGMLGKRFVLLGVAVGLGCAHALACGAFSGDDPAAPPASDAAAQGDVAGPDGAVDGARDALALADSDADAAACVTGPLSLAPGDPPGFPLLNGARALGSPSGDVVAIGRSICNDAGPALAMARWSGATVAPVGGCAALVEIEAPADLRESGGGWLFASTHFVGLARAKLRAIDGAGALTDLDENAGSGQHTYPSFAASVGGKVVFGGYVLPGTGIPRGFLRVPGGTEATLPADEVPVAAAVSGGAVFVLLVAAPAAPPSYVVVRKYTVVGPTPAEDAAFSTAGRTRLDLPAGASAAPTSFDPQGILVDGGRTVFVVPQSAGSYALVELGSPIRTVVPITSLGLPRIARRCGGVLVASVPPGGGGAVTVRSYDPSYTEDGALPSIFPGSQLVGVGASDRGVPWLAYGDGATVRVARLAR